jgi:hypothetical protein
MGEPQAADTLCHEWAHALAWNYSLDRLAKTPGLDPVEFERACHYEAWGSGLAGVSGGGTSGGVSLYDQRATPRCFRRT